MKKGFTLVEVLVVIAIVSIMGVLLTEIFFRSLRGGNKANLISSLKQNGQSVLDTMDKSIRNSDLVVCPQISGNSKVTADTLVILDDGIYTRYKFIKAKENPKANGKIERDNPKLLEGEPLKDFLNIICSPTDLLENPVSLTDTNAQTGISINYDKSKFTREKKSGFKDIVTIEFVVEAGVEVPKAISQQVDPVLFNTTIELR